MLREVAVGEQLADTASRSPPSRQVVVTPRVVAGVARQSLRSTGHHDTAIVRLTRVHSPQLYLVVDCRHCAHEARVLTIVERRNEILEVWDLLEHLQMTSSETT